MPMVVVIADLETASGAGFCAVGPVGPFRFVMMAKGL